VAGVATAAAAFTSLKQKMGLPEAPVVALPERSLPQVGAAHLCTSLDDLESGAAAPPVVVRRDAICMARCFF
jgi:hypothetical protein